MLRSRRAIISAAMVSILVTLPIAAQAQDTGRSAAEDMLSRIAKILSGLSFFEFGSGDWGREAMVPAMEPLDSDAIEQAKNEHDRPAHARIGTEIISGG